MRKLCIIFTLLIIMIIPLPSAFAISEEEKSFLEMYFKPEELQVISATKSLKSITRVAENVEVITAEDIELMNAHTAADALKNVNGVQQFIAGGSPGSIAMPVIQSSELKHVAVFLDGVLLNNLSGNLADLAVLPVQMIEKIEVIKGPASSVWGSSLGGVINIITKSGDKDKLSGTLSASYGEKNTGDIRAEMSGKKRGVGYYFYAGRLETDGFRPNEDFFNNTLYTKLSYDITNDTNVLFTLLYDGGDRGEGIEKDWDTAFSDEFRDLVTSFSLNSRLGKEIELNISLRAARQKYDFFMNSLSTGEKLAHETYEDSKLSAGVKLTWNTGHHNIVFGSDYDNNTIKTNIFTEDKFKIKKWAVFANDTITVGKLSIIPGLRYDHADITGDFISPSLGITYEIGNKTLIRAYVARGFSDPDILTARADSAWFTHNPDIKREEVWSYQLGAETGVLNYVWLKVAAFRHEIRDAIVDEDLPDGTFTSVNKDRVRRQGIEIAFRTKPVYHFTLFGSASFIEIKNLDTGEEIRDLPTNTYDVGLKYDDEKTFRALLTGHYIWWNRETFYFAKYSSMIFDLNMIKGIYKKKENSLEIFLTGHNIFNTSQYHASSFKNAKRWIEAGIRVKF